MNIQNGVSSVPVYQRWYSSPKMVQAARGRAMEMCIRDSACMHEVQGIVVHATTFALSLIHI